MNSFVFNNENYYHINNRFYDSSFIEVDSVMCFNLLKSYYKNFNFDLLNEAELLSLIHTAKEMGLYWVAKESSEYGLNNYKDFSFVTVVSPILSSSLRKLNKPQEAIKIIEKYNIINQMKSAPLLTSIAAAYCDLGNLVLAKKFANHASAKLYISKQESPELAMVYKRIKTQS